MANEIRILSGDELKAAYAPRIVALNPESAMALVVDNQERYDMAGILLGQYRDIRDEADRKFDPAVKAAHKAHKELLDLKRDLLATTVSAIAHLEGQLDGYARFVKAKADKEESDRQLALKAENEAKALEQASKLEQAGFTAAANAVVAQAATAPVVPVDTKPEGPGNLKASVIYYAQVKDEQAFKLLVLAVVAGQAPMQALMPNESFLNGEAKKFGKPGTIYPGVESVPHTSFKRSR